MFMALNEIIYIAIYRPVCAYQMADASNEYKNKILIAMRMRPHIIKRTWNCTKGKQNTYMRNHSVYP